jgi:hypothetical protein
MSVYGYALGDEAIQAFTSLRPRQRIKLLRVFDGLARDPNQVGYYREAGVSGRNYEVKLFDDLLLTRWVDHSETEVRIVRIERVD